MSTAEMVVPPMPGHQEPIDRTDNTPSEPSKDRVATTQVTRLTVNVGPSTLGALHSVADHEGVSITESLRRLISYGILLYRAIKDEDKEVLFRTKSGAMERVIIP
jgi:hypothetical protein